MTTRRTVGCECDFCRKMYAREQVSDILSTEEITALEHALGLDRFATCVQHKPRPSPGQVVALSKEGLGGVPKQSAQIFHAETQYANTPHGGVANWDAERQLASAESVRTHMQGVSKRGGLRPLVLESVSDAERRAKMREALFQVCHAESLEAQEVFDDLCAWLDTPGTQRYVERFERNAACEHARAGVAVLRVSAGGFVIEYCAHDGRAHTAIVNVLREASESIG